jgi:hypothetical protein
MLKIWISILKRICLSIYTEAKEFEKKVKKSDGYGGCFRSHSFIIILAYNQLAQFKKAKEMLEMGLDYL